MLHCRGMFAGHSPFAASPCFPLPALFAEVPGVTSIPTWAGSAIRDFVLQKESSPTSKKRCRPFELMENTGPRGLSLKASSAIRVPRVGPLKCGCRAATLGGGGDGSCVGPLPGGPGKSLHVLGLFEQYQSLPLLVVVDAER